MLMTEALSETEIEQLRGTHYNAAVTDVIERQEDLRILRIQPDWGGGKFRPGQYTVLGLGNWEPRVEGTDPEDLAGAELRKLLKRAYSFSCPMLDDAGRLVPPTYGDFFEFYIVLVRQREEKPPGLTPRLFALKPGDRMFMGQKFTGHYTLEGVRPDDNVVFVATGTGEAPHNTMVAELLSKAHQGRLVTVTCVRHRRDLGYLETHRELEGRYPNYQYLTLTTREPENLDPTVPGFVGKQYLQEFFERGDFERTSGLSLDPNSTHVYLCGNPAMIGAPIRGANGDGRYPKPRGMVEVLERIGFVADRGGNVHFEKYW